MAFSKAMASILATLMVSSMLFKLGLGISSTATYYDTYYPSACYGNDPLPSDNLFAAAAPSIYNNKAACGKYYCVKCTGNGCYNGNSIRVKIVDLCPGCRGAFDLSKPAFQRIANPDAGVINIDYNAC